MRVLKGSQSVLSVVQGKSKRGDAEPLPGRTGERSCVLSKDYKLLLKRFSQCSPKGDRNLWFRRGTRSSVGTLVRVTQPDRLSASQPMSMDRNREWESDLFVVVAGSSVIHFKTSAF